jgi:hypothetical protein
MCRLSRNSESLNLLESSGPVQAYIRNVLPLPLPIGLQVSKFELFPCKRGAKLGITVTWYFTLDSRYTWMVSFTLRPTCFKGETFLSLWKEGWVGPWGDLENCKIKQTLAPAGDGTTALKLKVPLPIHSADAISVFMGFTAWWIILTLNQPQDPISGTGRRLKNCHKKTFETWNQADVLGMG